MRELLSTFIRKNQLFLLFFLIVFAIGSAYLLRQDTIANTPLLIIPLTKVEIESGGSTSRVYKVTNTSGQGFLIASDGALMKNPSYVFEELHVNDFWNPVTCSRVPFVKSGSNIYFFEIKKVTEDNVTKNQSSLIKFNLETKEFLRFDLPQSVVTTGYVYLEKDVPYIAIPHFKNSLLKTVLLYSLNERGSSLDYIRTIAISNVNIAEPVFKRYQSQLALSYLDTDFTRHTYVYNGETLEAKSITIEDSIAFDEADFKIYKSSSSNFIKKVNLLHFDHIQIEDLGGETVLEIKDDNLNKYTITEL